MSDRQDVFILPLLQGLRVEDRQAEWESKKYLVCVCGGRVHGGQKTTLSKFFPRGDVGPRDQTQVVRLSRTLPLFIN